VRAGLKASGFVYLILHIARVISCFFFNCMMLEQQPTNLQVLNILRIRRLFSTHSCVAFGSTCSDLREGKTATIYVCLVIYTGCPKRKGQYSGRSY
jgi:hypothetical protein